MVTDEWSLTGDAYGRIYASSLALVKKEEVKIPANVVEEHLRVARKLSDPEYRKIVEVQEQATFRSETGDTIMVAPRYVGSRLGSDDDGHGNTICAFHFNGEYAALALYHEANKQLVVQEY